MQVLLSVFNWVLLSSVMATVPACVILLVKAVLKNRLGARWHYYIWLLLVIRLMVPYSFQSPFSIYNIADQAFEALPVSLEAPVLSGEKRSVRESTEKEGNVPSNSGAVQTVIAANVGDSVRAEFIGTAPESGLMKFAMVWLAGALIFLLYTVFINIGSASKIRRSGRPADGPTEALLNDCRLLMNIGRSIPVLLSMSVRTPALTGFVRPKILLPSDTSGELNADELRYVFLHELAHYKRKDIFFVWLAFILKALHWFNPLIWYCFYRMDQDCETACDTMVLSRIKPDEHLKYGHTIIHLLELIPSLPRSAPGAVGILSDKARLKRRLAMISLFKKESIPWTVAAIILILSIGFICLTNAKAGGEKYAESENNMANQKLSALQNELQKQNEKNHILESNLQKQNDEYKALTDLTSKLKEQLKNYEMLAGKTDIKGKGIIVTLRDNTDNAKNDADRFLWLVRDSDVRNMVNELAGAGAEAVSVNDERLIATSEIKASGMAILINNNSYSNPFIIKAIGDPDVLEHTLLDGEFTKLLQSCGLIAGIEKSESLTIPMYKGDLDFKYAQPMEMSMPK